MDRKAHSTLPAPADGATQGVPDSFLDYPFAYESCELKCDPTAEEKAAYCAHYRACQSREEFWNRAPSADWMLDILAKLWDALPSNPEQELRTFALRCAEGLQGAANPKAQELLDVVRGLVSGAATLDDLGALQARMHGHIAQGGVQGLPRCSTYAAATLAAWHAAGHDPHSAALWSSEFAARHDAFMVLAQQATAWHWPEDRGERWRESWRTAFFAKAHPEVEAAALADARRRQADLLRSILPTPFGLPVRCEVYFRPARDTDRMSVYCMTCGVQRGDATPGVLFDVRGVLCTSCKAPVARCVH